MALPYATENQLKQLKVQLEKKIQAGGGTSGEIPTKLSQLTNDTGFITDSALVDYALKTEIPDVSTLATKEEVEEVKSSIPSIEELATKAEVNEAVKDVVKYESFQNPNDDALRKTIKLANHDTISGVDTTGAGRNLIMLSKWDKVDVGAAGVSINLNGKDARPTYNDEKELALKEDIPTDYLVADDLANYATVDDLEWMPVICNMNFRTLADRVYTQEEIFAWFFIEDLVGLKNLILKHPIYLRYGISLSGNPMYYYIPCQYVAFTDANTVEMITDGLDTRNDKFSRYHVTIKLDGTVINGASNIKVELKENVFVPDLPEDADTKTYQLKAVNGVLTWVE